MQHVHSEATRGASLQHTRPCELPVWVASFPRRVVALSAILCLRCFQCKTLNGKDFKVGHQDVIETSSKRSEANGVAARLSHAECQT